MMYQPQIVHIPNVMPYSQPLLDIVVEIVQHREFDELRYLTAQTDALVAAKAVDNAADVISRALIAYSLSYYAKIASGATPEAR